MAVPSGGVAVGGGRCFRVVRLDFAKKRVDTSCW